MAIPQFTGEASVYRSVNQYHSVTPVNAPAIGASAAVIPPPILHICAVCERNPRLCSPALNCICAGGTWLAHAHECI